MRTRGVEYLWYVVPVIIRIHPEVMACVGLIRRLRVNICLAENCSEYLHSSPFLLSGESQLVPAIVGVCSKSWNARSNRTAYDARVLCLRQDATQSSSACAFLLALVFFVTHRRADVHR